MNLQQDLISFGQDFQQYFLQLLPRIARGAALLIIGAITIKFLMRLFARFIDYLHISLGLKEITLILTRAALWVLLAIGILQVLDLTNVAFALGGFIAVLSIGISQGFTQTVTDLVSGIMLANDHDFRVGDKVIVGEKDHRIVGYIIEMDTKKSRLIDEKGDLHIFPNALIDRNEWTLLERDEITLAHLGRDDIIKVIKHKHQKGSKK